MKSILRSATFVGGLVAAATAIGQAQNSTAGTVEVRFSGSLAGTRTHSVMVSVVQNNGVVQQGETVIPDDKRFTGITAGTYDVRAEGAGLVTQVKRGVHVTAGQTLDLEFVMKAGTGAEVTEFAAAVLSREEIETRLRKLEAETADLQRRLTDLEKTAVRQTPTRPN
jgi:hypothetical protein